MRASDTDHSGLISDLLRLGTIEAVDLAAGMATVKCGDVVSPPLRWAALSGSTALWVPPSVDEQILLLCPEGDISAGVILRGIYSDANPAPGNDATLRLKFPDGSEVTYDPEANELVFTLTGKTKFVVPEGFKIEGDLEVEGKIDATGEIKTPEDIKAGTVSLKTHKHSGVSAGAAQTGAPV